MWMKMFDNYMLAINAMGDTWLDERQCVVLLNSLRTEGQKIFNTLPNAGNNKDNAVAALKAHFTPTVNVVVVVKEHKDQTRLQLCTLLHCGNCLYTVMSWTCPEDCSSASASSQRPQKKSHYKHA